MPDVKASLEYLQDLPLYQEEKPYWCFLPPSDGFDPDEQRVDNLEFEHRNEILIRDIRGVEKKFRLDPGGFEVLSHGSRIPKFDSAEATEAYQRETEMLLKDALGACHVVCYDLRLRKNVTFHRNQFDLNDPLLTEGPARGVHNDITYDSGPAIINRYLTELDKETYLRSGFRVRIINTWRSLLPILEDRPLALCDSRTVEPSDLVASDRVIPDRIGEVYYLKYNPKHEWYWLSGQQSTEPYAFVMYDTKGGDHARFCPHVSFRNSLASKVAPPRESVETRSIVITRQ